MRVSSSHLPIIALPLPFSSSILSSVLFKLMFFLYESNVRPYRLPCCRKCRLRKFNNGLRWSLYFGGENASSIADKRNRQQKIEKKNRKKKDWLTELRKRRPRTTTSSAMDGRDRIGAKDFAAVLRFSCFRNRRMW